MTRPAAVTGPPAEGAEMHALVERLFPICRSLTGDGVRQTLSIIGEYVPIGVREVPTGTPVLDWTVPKEWNVREAWVRTLDGRPVVDFRDSNLHLVGYSVPVRRRVTLGELKQHLHSLPDRPGWIPYRTSYYEERWGFCLQHDRLCALRDDHYEVCVDSTLEDGHLTFGELLLEGESESEVLVSCHICHPSLCNDNLSGIAVATFLAQHLASASRRRYSYRFLFVPGTIGPITWLALNEPRVHRIAHGLVLTLLGDPGAFTYKRSRRGDAEIDRAVEHVLHPLDSEARNFSPWGYDERQYCSPGFDLPVGCLMRTPHGEFPEYHTSADDLDLVRPESLAESLAVVSQVVEVLEGNASYVNRSPKGEPQLGRRGLYGSLGGGVEGRQRQLALLWVLNLSDGDHSLLDIADRAGLPFATIRQAADLLLDHELLD
jgi:aminopeptidase-like protein